MRVLVTGAAGFIGSHLVRRLVADGHEVRATDIRTAWQHDGAERLVGDLTDPFFAFGLMDDIEVVFHQAAIPSVPRSMAEPRRTHRANIDVTFHVFEAARLAGVRRVIYAASSSVYGGRGEAEEDPARPESLYAVQKHVGELYGRVYRKLGLDVVSLRYFNVFGPGQDPNSEYAAVIPKFIRMMRSGQRPTIYGDGQQTRDFTYIDNVVHANLLAATALEDIAGTSINVGTGRQISLNSLVTHLNDLLGTSLEPEYLPARLGDVKRSRAEIGRAWVWLGYRPVIGFQEGLRRTVEEC